MPQDRSPVDGDSDFLSRQQLLLANGWKLNQKKTGLKKSFTFENWTRCHVRYASDLLRLVAHIRESFADLVAVESWLEDHHALLIISRRDATIFWTTYRPSLNVSKSDIYMAEVTDKLAAKIGSCEGPNQLDIQGNGEGAKRHADAPDGWQLEGTQLSRTFYFATYTKCRDFFTVVAIRCKSIGCWPRAIYFPCWVQIQWPEVSPKSIEMAQFCDIQANQIGMERKPDIGAEIRILSNAL